MKTMFRMWWMFFWRLWVLSFIGLVLTKHTFATGFAIAVVSAIASVVLYKGFRIEILDRPIKRMLAGQQWYVRYSTIVRTPTPVRPSPTTTAPPTPVSAPPFTTERPIRREASVLGKMSGYEDTKLKDITIPNLPTMYGDPGAGLDKATGKFGNMSVRLGQKGEQNFAKALSITEMGSAVRNTNLAHYKSMLGNFHSFWSVSLPEVPGKNNYDTDVDCVLVYGSKMLLVDLKYYSGGDVTYYAHNNMLYTVDNKSTEWVGKPKKMTFNMEMAQDRFRYAFPTYTVESIVVLMPTSKGMGKLSTPPYTPMYPGEIPLANIDFALNWIKHYFYGEMDDESNNAVFFDGLKNLLRDGSTA